MVKHPIKNNNNNNDKVIIILIITSIILLSCTVYLSNKNLNKQQYDLYKLSNAHFENNVNNYYYLQNLTYGNNLLNYEVPELITLILTNQNKLNNYSDEYDCKFWSGFWALIMTNKGYKIQYVLVPLSDEVQHMFIIAYKDQEYYILDEAYFYRWVGVQA